ncbi:Y-family DNA polymerase [Mycoplasma bradburyae]|uniref:DNA polymerase IV n=1 Tax=Mycoplasma bradburyae TaxID=2963128 RepID=A0ABT5G9V6_9MOLU|nr:DNA polymerase IV [Mycoplasma bradburyae]MDC4181618.1 DNA polymerase IV [Mycoplasma bradburyae]UTS69960.1 DNA polymerase IV [Mycoplasma bradburyae]
MARKTIFHIDFDAFFASVEEKSNPEYINKPLVVGSKSHGSIVSSANYVARNFGVRSAMPIFQAKKLCPSLIIAEVDFSKYEKVSAYVFTYLRDFITKKIEVASIDECYLDVTDILEKNRNLSAVELAKMIQRQILELTNLTVSIGISSNLFLAKMATDQNKPNGVYEIWPEEIKEKLWPINISKMYLIGSKKIPVLNELNIKNIGNFAQFKDREKLISIFKNMYWTHYNHANGKGDDFVNYENSSRKSVSVSRNIRYMVRNYDSILDIFDDLFDEIYQRLKNQNLLTKNVSVSLKNNKTISLSYSFKQFIDKRSSLYNKAVELLDRLHNDEIVSNIGISFNNIKKKYKYIPNINIYQELSKEQKDLTILKKIVSDINNETNKELLNIAEDFDYFKYQK